MLHNKKRISFVLIGSILGAFFSFVSLAVALEVDQYDVIKPFLDKHCISCHGPDKQKADFRIDTLGSTIKSSADAEHWQEMLDLINTGEMPPPEEPQPTSEELKAVLEPLYKTTSNARDVMVKSGNGKMRRMNRREYVNTVYDRLGVTPNENLLPVDPGDFGFDTFRKELVVTPTQLLGYMSSAEDLAKRLVALISSRESKPKEIKYIFGELLYKKKAELSTPRANQWARPMFERFVETLYKGKPSSISLVGDMEKLFKEGRSRGLDFWSATYDPLVVALASPNFIYIVEKRQALDQVEIANRMALLLWGAASPDEELVDLAKRKQLLSKKDFVEQILRMLNDKKSERFYESFGDQWLELDRLDLVVVDKDRFPDVAKNYDKLKVSMRKEVREFLKELIKNNEPANKLVSSDFTIVDPLLAKYYGVNYPRQKRGFQKVKLEGANLARGGLLGKGAVQVLTSTGSRNSPVERGVYILRKLLNRPPPPAPANVPEVEDNKGENVALRELLSHHSTTAQCATCHARIDPLGFGMELFGPMGRIQKFENQHEVGKSGGVRINPSGQLPNGKSFNSYGQFASLLAQEDEKIARSYVSALMSYALGRPIGFTDRGQIDQIIEESRERGFKLAELTFRVCASPYFRTKN